MMTAIRNKEINCVVVKDLSRLGRNFLETGELIEITLPSFNVRLIAINDFYDSAMELSVNEALRFELQNLVNEYYSKDISLKTSSAMATLREKGAFLGNCAPYGYQKHANNKYKLAVDIPAAEIVQSVFEMKAKEMSYGAIARHLTAERIASPRLYKAQHTIRTTAMTSNENPWSIPMIKNILTNPVYLGNMIQGRRSSTGNDIAIMNTHEAIIEPQLYEEAQARIKKNRSIYFESHGKYSHFEETENILKGYAYCGECGGRLTRRKEVYADGSKRQYVYVCARHDSYGNEICANKFRMHETLLLKSVLEQIQEYIFNIFNGTASKYDGIKRSHTQVAGLSDHHIRRRRGFYQIQRVD